MQGWERTGNEIKYNPYDVAVTIKGNNYHFDFYREEND